MGLPSQPSRESAARHRAVESPPPKGEPPYTPHGGGCGEFLQHQVRGKAAKLLDGPCGIILLGQDLEFPTVGINCETSLQTEARPAGGFHPSISSQRLAWATCNVASQRMKSRTFSSSTWRAGEGQTQPSPEFVNPLLPKTLEVHARLQ